MIIPNIWENKIDVPNHQPDIFVLILPVLYPHLSDVLMTTSNIFIETKDMY